MVLDVDSISLFISVAAPLAGGAFVTTLGYIYGRRHDRDFSLLGKLWEKKIQGFEQISIAMEKTPQLLALIQDILTSKARTKTQRIDLYEMLASAEIMNKFHGATIDPKIERLMNTPGLLDNHIRSKTVAQLDNDIQIIIQLCYRFRTDMVVK